jgi:predicted nucleic acid-binding protein
MSDSNYLLLDTSVLIAHLRKMPGVKALLERFREQMSFAISTITLVEVWQGAKPAETEQTRLLLQGLDDIPLDAVLAEKAGQLAYQLRIKGYTCDLADAVIGVTAINRNAPVLTTNIKHFEAIPGLDIWDLRSMLAEDSPCRLD